ncbi:hypothetical protein MKY41_11305 [Sporosarcina sp. FSL W7-1349]|uniref:hypothetical protein n=1 Tax=Sporosarcina sp. FSL W7-1349 TaxID=2921561 RepID=UPI0030F97565
MPLIPVEALPKFENAIYFPLLIQVLERDRVAVERGPFKLKGPYLKLIDQALKNIHAEQKETNAYLRANKMKVIKGGNDGTFTEYSFLHDGYEDSRKYLNVRLRNRTEELMSVYFAMVEK